MDEVFVLLDCDGLVDGWMDGWMKYLIGFGWMDEVFDWFWMDGWIRCLIDFGWMDG